MHQKLRSLALAVLVLALAVAAPAAQGPAAPKVTTPETFFGHQIGADYQLPNYTKFSEFVHRLDKESDRMIVQSIGKTAEGRDQLMAIITSPENHKNLATLQGHRAPAGAGRGPHRRRRRARWPARARRSSGSTAACTPPRCSARSS